MELTEQFIEHDGMRTAYIEAGEGPPLLLLHGSGPGVSALANWRGTMQSDLISRYRLIAPDVVGFGMTSAPEGTPFDQASRLRQLAGFMDAMGLGKVGLVGNSMGGALALGLAHHHRERIERMVLMGTVGISFPITPPLDEVWGYEPSIPAMEGVIRHLAHNQSLVSDDLVKLRYEASLEPGVQERYAAAFAAPRQRHVDDMALSEEQIAAIDVPTLLIHGIHDHIVPLKHTSLRIAELMPDADLVVFGRVGHWTQIERAADFQRVVGTFFETMLKSG
jgi:2-hydroxymuconate-semialdehyde hydrolase